MATTDELERRIQILERWKEERIKNQISLPLDQISINVLQKYFIQVLGAGAFLGASGLETPFWTVKNNNKITLIDIYNLNQISVNVSTNVITADHGNFVNDSQVEFIAASNDPNVSPALPSPLSPGALYYVINSSGNSFKVSLTLGGAAIDITNTGTGVSYIL